MTIVIPKDYHLKNALENGRINCLTVEAAEKQDIRPLRVGVLNIMPQVEKYEYRLLHPLGRSVMQIEPVWIRLTNHVYSSSDRDHLEHVYVSFEDAIKSDPLDGLIITGAPVEEIPYDKISYWPEMMEILAYAKESITNTLGMCWGGMALAKFMDIDTVIYKKKLFGVFETTNLNNHHPITGELDDVFWCPQSRHAGFTDQILEDAERAGVINLLAYIEEKESYTIFESADRRFLSHLGHPEYNAMRLVEEYSRDAAKGRDDVEAPCHLDLDKPVNRWRGHRTEFYTQWIKFLYDAINSPEEV